jgi:hypothetical protein
VPLQVVINDIKLFLNWYSTETIIVTLNPDHSTINGGLLGYFGERATKPKFDDLLNIVKQRAGTKEEEEKKMEEEK